MARSTLLTLLVLPLAGCGETSDPHSPTEDAGVDVPDAADAGDTTDDGGPAPPLEPALPSPPEVPRMVPCPNGWREVADVNNAALAHCEPFPGTDVPACAEEEAFFPGGADCEPLGDDCPPSGFPEGFEAGVDVLYVRAGEPEGGDGSLDRPFSRVADAVDAAGDGSVIALSTGVFDESVLLDRPITLVGACVAGTRVEPSEPRAALKLRAAATVRQLQVGGRSWGIEITHTGGAAAVIESVLVAHAGEGGLRVEENGLARASNLVVRDTGGVLGGIYVGPDGELELDRAVVERAETAGVDVDAGRLEAVDLVVADTLVESTTGAGGMGLWLGVGGSADLERVVLLGNRTAGIVADTGAALVARDAFIAESQEVERLGGDGIFVDSARADLARVVIARAEGAGVVVYQPTAELTMRDSIVADSRGGVDAILEARVQIERVALARNGRGVSIDEATASLVDTSISDSPAGIIVGYGGHCDMERVAIERALGEAVAVSLDGSEIVGTDLTITDTLPGEEGFGAALGVTRGGAAAFERVSIAGGAGVGVTEGGTMSLADLSMTDSRGILIGNGSHCDIERVTIERNVAVGIAVADPDSSAVVTDVIVRGTRPPVDWIGGGAGILVGPGASMTLTRAWIVDNESFGVVAFGAHPEPGSTTLVAEDLVTELSVENACAGDVCSSAPGGIGLAATDGAVVEATRFRSSDNPLCGVLVATGGGLDLHDGEVSRNAIGANVQVDDFDFARIEDRVRYVDNGRNLDSTRLPIPDPMEGLDQ